MFTGIIAEIGQIAQLAKERSLVKLGIKSQVVAKDAVKSDSISINGVCLTLVTKKNELLLFEAIAPTLKNTNLNRLKKGDFVNLEPALKLGQKVGGHFVLGHADAELRLRRIIKRGSYWELEIELPSRFRRFIVENGSITIEGISLTIKKILSRVLTVDIVPFTYGNTNLKYKKSGSWLNIEFDYLLKSKGISA